MDTGNSQAFRIAVLTASDSRTAADDRSGNVLAEGTEAEGHVLADRRIVADDIFQLRAALSVWIADPDIDVILVTGGTGPTGRDNTIPAVKPLLEREMPGFGELFRQISYDEIGVAAMLSGAIGGVANGTLIFCLPGSTGACRTAWNRILAEQLRSDGKHCNLAALRSRFTER